jgi:hypothetical protein
MVSTVKMGTEESECPWGNKMMAKQQQQQQLFF